MDLKILQSILDNTVVSTKNESSNENTTQIECDQFPTIKDELIDRLSQAFTKLLSYKVSKAAYQRYAVRLNIIETLRDWACLKGEWNIRHLAIFQDTEYSSNFFIQLLRRYLTPQIIMKCDNVNCLTQLAEILIHLEKNNKTLKNCCIKVIERIIDLEQSEVSENFLRYLVTQSSDLNIDPSLIEKVYISQKSKLVEKPLTDCFVSYCTEPNKQDQFDQMDCLFENIVDSPLLFQMVANQLKEFFVMSKYAEETQKFIQNILERIQTHCNKYNKDTLDLYPSSLQFCVILLRIKPSYYTENCKRHAVESLKQVFLKDYNDALILISHFPEWLPEYLKFFENNEDLNSTTKSNLQSMDDVQSIIDDVENIDMSD